MESYQFIENPLAESKSISKSVLKSLKMTSAQRGLWAETVVRQFLIQKKWSILACREKYKFGEIDLIVGRKKNIAIVEVKYLNSEWMAFQRIDEKQILRLKKNYIYLSESEFKDKNVKLFLCFVKQDLKINWINLFE